MLKRRTILQAGAGLVLAAPAIAQTRRRISFLTWNIIDQEPLIRGWIASFERANPGAEVEWLDKKGPELPPFYQTQLAASTPPDAPNCAMRRSPGISSIESPDPTRRQPGTIEKRKPVSSFSGARQSQRTPATSGIQASRGQRIDSRMPSSSRRGT